MVAEFEQPVNANAYIKCGLRLRYMILFTFQRLYLSFALLSRLLCIPLSRGFTPKQANDDDNLNNSTENDSVV